LFSKLIWYLRLQREIAISTFQVVDKPLSSSLCSILTQCFIWYSHKLKKASVIIICCTKTPLSVSPYQSAVCKSHTPCYGLKNFFQCCTHLPFSDRSLISSNHHFQFLSSTFWEIYHFISAAMICVSGTRDIYRAFMSGNVIPCRPSPSWLCMWIVANFYFIIKNANTPFSLSFPRQLIFDHSGFCGVNFHFFDANFYFKFEI